jgi:hypothetical protein
VQRRMRSAATQPGDRRIEPRALPHPPCLSRDGALSPLSDAAPRAPWIRPADMSAPPPAPPAPAGSKPARKQVGGMGGTPPGSRRFKNSLWWRCLRPAAEIVHAPSSQAAAGPACRPAASPPPQPLPPLPRPPAAAGARAGHHAARWGTRRRGQPLERQAPGPAARQRAGARRAAAARAARGWPAARHLAAHLAQHLARPVAGPAPRRAPRPAPGPPAPYTLASTPAGTRVRSKYKCNPQLDSGKTRGDIGQTNVFCSFFARWAGGGGGGGGRMGGCGGLQLCQLPGPRRRSPATGALAPRHGARPPPPPPPPPPAGASARRARCASTCTASPPSWTRRAA